MYRTLIEEDIVEENPTRGVTVKSPDSKPFRPLEKEEFALMLEHLKTDELRFFAKFLITTGMRYGEASEVRVYDYNDARREILLTRSATLMPKRQANGSRVVVKKATKSGFNRVIRCRRRLTRPCGTSSSSTSLVTRTFYLGAKPCSRRSEWCGKRRLPATCSKTATGRTAMGPPTRTTRANAAANSAPRRGWSTSGATRTQTAIPRSSRPWSTWITTPGRRRGTTQLVMLGCRGCRVPMTCGTPNATALLSGKVDIFEVMQRLGTATSQPRRSTCTGYVSPRNEPPRLAISFSKLLYGIRLFATVPAKELRRYAPQSAASSPR